MLYDRPTVDQNEITLYIARGVHCEVKLHKRFDWSTVKGVMGGVRVPDPANGMIPMGVYRYPDGGLRLRANAEEEVPMQVIESDDSASDDDSDGTHEIKALSARTLKAQKRKRDQRMTFEALVVAQAAEGLVVGGALVLGNEGVGDMPVADEEVLGDVHVAAEEVVADARCSRTR